MSRATRIGPIARIGKDFYFTLNRQECPTWTFLFFCAIRPPAGDGLPYRELFFLHTKPLSIVPPDMRAGRRYAPLSCSLCVLALELGPCGLGGFPPRGRKIPATAGFYGVWALGLTPRRAGGRCPPRPRWSVRSDRGGPSCPSGGLIPLAAPSPCRDGAGR